MTKNTAYATLEFSISLATGQEQNVEQAIKGMTNISILRCDRELITFSVIGSSVQWEPDWEIENETFATVQFYVTHDFECETWELEWSAYYLLNDLSIHDDIYLENPDGTPITMKTHNIEIEWYTKPLIAIA
ncbi:hypothetical protein [Brevibacillus parabrevis]|jgi:hypothetical protein|uniref:hypothetical protein n=1 Tax=Brevibacillus parabrevis TaxID=54914 RepID=UPI002492B46F|nr:hypothetical protein [Brevibacillus parabrevis]